ncbi:MAG: hypothetical protein ABFD97_19495, partial [Syntrophobacter sp.]
MDKEGLTLNTVAQGERVRARLYLIPLKKQLLRVINIKDLHGNSVIHPVIPAEAGIQGFANASQAED